METSHLALHPGFAKPSFADSGLENVLQCVALIIATGYI